MKNAAKKATPSQTPNIHWDSVLGGQTTPNTRAKTFNQFTVPQTMSDEEVPPPAYIWNNISKELDYQDKAKNNVLRVMKADTWMRIAIAITAFAAVGLLIYALL